MHDRHDEHEDQGIYDRAPPLARVSRKEELPVIIKPDELIGAARQVLHIGKGIDDRQDRRPEIKTMYNAIGINSSNNGMKRLNPFPNGYISLTSQIHFNACRGLLHRPRLQYGSFYTSLFIIEEVYFGAAASHSFAECQPALLLFYMVRPAPGIPCERLLRPDARRYSDG